jgi:hypothetical protein
VAERRSFATAAALALVPLALLGVVLWILVASGPSTLFHTSLPPVEELHVLRHTLEPD